MSRTFDAAEELYLGRISLAMVELAKGMKSVNFYPPEHPILVQAITKIVLLFEDIPPPENGLEINVTKNKLLFNDLTITGGGNVKAISDLNRELYIRRAAKVIFLPNLTPGEVVSFLKAVSRDANQVLDEGGLEKVLLKEKVSRIWVNRVNYDKLSEILKDEEELEEVEPEEIEQGFFPETLEYISQSDEPEMETLTLDSVLARIEKEIDHVKYQIHITTLIRLLSVETLERYIEYSCRVIPIFIRHIESPPEKNQEIARLASMGIKELAHGDLIHHYIKQLKSAGIRGRQETETILAAIGEKAADPLLHALAEEKDILLRKTIVSIVVRIGEAAIPAILENLGDPRWYMVRNMVTILGSIDMPDLTPYIISTISHPDLRVKREAIKALSKVTHPSTVTTLCDLCFHPNEMVALAAIAALSSKKEPQAVVTLFRRITAKKYLYPNYRLAYEAIDSLRTIGTDDAAIALEEVLGMNVFWRTEQFQSMKAHALRSLYTLKGNAAGETLQNALQGNDKILRREAKRILKLNK